MADRKNNVLSYLFLCCISVLVIPFVASCGKGNVLPAGSNIQMQVVNLSPDLLPVNLWVGHIKRTAQYNYPIPSGYFSLTSIDTPLLQIRPASTLVPSGILVSLDTILKPNVKYTLFVTGLRANNSITSIFTVDTASISTVGRGKIRFVNASPASGGLDVTANGTLAFTNQDYKEVSKFIEIPPGNYDFKIMPTGTTATELATIRSIAVQDGKLYTLYCHGLVGRVDSAAFRAGVLANK